MTGEPERFLARWSRLKQDQAPTGSAPSAAPVAASTTTAALRAPQAGEQEPPPLPPLEELTPESDFSAFMAPKVSDALRRAALKKLFRHPEIDLPDMFEPFSGDWTSGAPMAADMLAQLHEARAALLRRCSPNADVEPEPIAAPALEVSEHDPPEAADHEADPTDEPGRQDA